ncbi:CLUMA_CG007069, isoform A [Clunio marinus]|uniref:CLUMA_CG007069, isoform A n=1 Tax=Clunio marinus TaxID=568069 RepID=A0A1J1HZK8_9DIPT|nr:CLUMA_CG007069, isoform A [Clunio marinus]
MKSLKCKVVKDLYYPNMTCYAKPYNRTTSMFTVYVKFKKPLDDFSAKLLFEYRYCNIYREIIKSPKFNWCSKATNTNTNTKANNTNPLVKIYYRTLKLSDEILVRKCPINEFNDKNIVMSTDAFPDIALEII